VALLREEGVDDPLRPWVVAEHRRRFVGALQWTNTTIPAKTGLRTTWTFATAAGLTTMPRMLLRGRVWSRVQLRPPRDSFHIREIHVKTEERNKGVGGALLRWAEVEARHRDFATMSLVTHTANPARRLYERAGYRVVETRTDPRFERYTGIEGRQLMVKDLTQSSG
jgi:ribosomal protein S18 acetylase RimI-like enzyme